ncbi:hypothetical protein CSAL01_02333 [Colletotrichum salicis]|uniref:Uncharacterized protein n=1 Tax=Colletotrichum salicis TaxID=1209931 RepID=A0A135UL65_9PEZI|nr:hypothetical protein CSAL01_02333 [Colletotrichum salicis]
MPPRLNWKDTVHSAGASPVVTLNQAHLVFRRQGWQRRDWRRFHFYPDPCPPASNSHYPPRGPLFVKPFQWDTKHRAASMTISTTVSHKELYPLGINVHGIQERGPPSYLTTNQHKTFHSLVDYKNSTTTTTNTITASHLTSGFMCPPRDNGGLFHFFSHLWWGHQLKIRRQLTKAHGITTPPGPAHPAHCWAVARHLGTNYHVFMTSTNKQQADWARNTDTAVLFPASASPPPQVFAPPRFPTWGGEAKPGKPRDLEHPLGHHVSVPKFLLRGDMALSVQFCWQLPHINKAALANCSLDYGAFARFLVQDSRESGFNSSTCDDTTCRLRIMPLHCIKKRGRKLLRGALGDGLPSSLNSLESQSAAALLPRTKCNKLSRIK